MSGLYRFMPQGTTVYTATMSATATCPDNPEHGVTRTATRFSLVSQADAETLAYDAALGLAHDALDCDSLPGAIYGGKANPAFFEPGSRFI
jgi:hypothetical protein